MDQLEIYFQEQLCAEICEFKALKVQNKAMQVKEKIPKKNKTWRDFRIVIWWACYAPPSLVDIGLTDLPKTREGVGGTPAPTVLPSCAAQAMIHSMRIHEFSIVT